MRRARVVLGLAVALSAGCGGDGGAGGDAGIAADAGADGGGAAGPTRYPAGATRSPVTEAVAAQLRAIAARGQSRGDVFAELAEAAAFPDDFSYVIYRLRPGSRWHDGKPVTPEDVIFSFEALKANSPMFSAYYRHIAKAEKIGDRDVKFTFESPGNRELPMITGQLIILPKHWREGTDAQGKKRDITASTLEPPLGSGPYKMKEFVAGRSVVLERVKDYWGKDIPVAIGQNNFDELRYEYFRDDTVAREALKADGFDSYNERSAKEWASAYDVPPVRENRLLKELFTVRNQGRMQGWVFNLRRPKFADPSCAGPSTMRSISKR